MAIVVGLPLFGVGESYCGPGGINAQGNALHKAMTVADTNDFDQRKVAAQPATLGPRTPQHPSRFEMRLKLGKHLV